MSEPEIDATQITDEFMRAMLTQTKPYTVVLLKMGPDADRPDRDAIIWEHGRRNFALRAGGMLAIVCPIRDDSDWAGVGVFNGEPDDIARVMDGDPAVRAGVLSYEVHPVRSFPGDCLPAPNDVK
jgi:hypothetical protein